MSEEGAQERAVGEGTEELLLGGVFVDSAVLLDSPEPPVPTDPFEPALREPLLVAVVLASPAPVAPEGEIDTPWLGPPWHWI